MRTMNAQAARCAAKIGNEFSALLAGMPNKFFCLTFDQESRVWEKVISAYDSGTHSIDALKRVARQAVEEV